MLGLKKKSYFKELHVFAQNYVADVHIPSLIDCVKKSLGKINGTSVVYYTSLIRVIISFHCTCKHIFIFLLGNGFLQVNGIRNFIGSTETKGK